ncbi:hypothetical protein CEXT_711471 [Caerostris extrusa]|uniref:Uncharacterized protein n=1 Tax=Caerostris extrusa TaxID=172846 RepID=A0AAV4QUG8_CAEEX|nr:hypothetical protein CEXT_711471 [Caerostris extrusa]
MARPLETLAKKERRFCSLPECKHQKGSGRFLPESNHQQRYNWSVPGQTFRQRSLPCVCGHSFEDRSHIIYDCPEWEEIRRRFFPPNHKEGQPRAPSRQQKSRQGIRDMLQIKLQALLRFFEDNEH